MPWDWDNHEVSSSHAGIVPNQTCHLCRHDTDGGFKTKSSLGIHCHQRHSRENSVSTIIICSNNSVLECDNRNILHIQSSILIYTKCNSYRSVMIRLLVLPIRVCVGGDWRVWLIIHWCDTPGKIEENNMRAICNGHMSRRSWQGAVECVVLIVQQCGALPSKRLCTK